MSKKTPHATIDIETDPFERGRMPVPFASAIHDGDMTLLFWGIACIIDLVHACIKHAQKSGSCIIYYAHNGGKFDMHFLLPSLIAIFGRDGIVPLNIGPRMVQMIIRDGNNKTICEFRDSFAIIPKPQKAIGGKKLDIEIWKLEDNEISLTEKKYPGALAQFHKDQKEKGVIYTSPRSFYKEEICRYLRRDVSGLHEAVTEFFALYGINMTLASAAFKILRKKFEMPAVKSDEKFDEVMRKFYFAGHVEFFGLGEFKGEYNICDINSAFPRAMLEKHWFSTSFIRTSSVPPIGKETCFYQIKCISHKALPFRTKSGGVAFPDTEGEFFATGWELFTGIDLGLITDVEILAIYRPIEIRDFTNYVEYFYEQKKNAETEAERNFSKLFLNAAYGKFALNPREFRDTKITPFGEIPPPEKKKVNKQEIMVEWEHSYDNKDTGLSFWQRPSNHGEKPLHFYNVGTAASITGWVRAFLMRSLKACEGVLYCDTDSIIARDTSKLELGENLGQWKLEKKCDTVWIAGKKLYCARDSDWKSIQEKADKLESEGKITDAKKERSKKYKIASKGVRLTPEQIISVANGNEESFGFDAPNYSAFSKPHFTSRRVNRDDKRKKK